MADSTAKKVDGFDSRINSKATATSVYSWQVTDTKIVQASSRTLSQANAYTDDKVANAKPDFSGYYQKSEVDNKDLAFKNMAVSESKTYTDQKTSNLDTNTIQTITLDQYQSMKSNKSFKSGVIYAVVTDWSV